MDQVFNPGFTRNSRKLGCRIDVDGTKRVLAALNVQADRVYNAIGALKGCRSTSGSLWISALMESSPGVSGSSIDVIRSGRREAARTSQLRARRCLTTRRPRKPVPPNTTTSRRGSAVLLPPSIKSPRQLIALPFLSAAYSTKRAACGDFAIPHLTTLRSPISRFLFRRCLRMRHHNSSSDHRTLMLKSSYQSRPTRVALRRGNTCSVPPDHARCL